MSCSPKKSATELPQADLASTVEKIIPSVKNLNVAGSRSMIFRYEIKNLSNKLLKTAKVSVAIPASEAQRHQIIDIKSNLDGQVKTDILGNQKYSLTLSGMAPHSHKILTLNISILEIENQTFSVTDNMDMYVSETELIPFKHSAFLNPILSVKGGTDAQTVNNAYHWVVNHMNYAGYIPQSYGALYALTNGRGDCTEYMHLLAALLRGNGIPTMLVGGYVYKENVIVSPADYHNWVEVYINGEWRVVDAQKEHYDDNDNNYIVMTYLDTPKLEGQKFSSSEDISVKMF